ncbi:hypothetical protein V1477_002788 [Vespula maculifrons]|uniref:Uncharacterized protein n=1 Tax=Vespula maculifrons TaxID=7453 RepID=A0ABD2CYG0_VESMC
MSRISSHTGVLSVTIHPYSAHFLFEKDTNHSPVHKFLTTVLSYCFFGDWHLSLKIFLLLISESLNCGFP